MHDEIQLRFHYKLHDSVRDYVICIAAAPTGGLKYDEQCTAEVSRSTRYTSTLHTGTAHRCRWSALLQSRYIHPAAIGPMTGTSPQASPVQALRGEHTIVHCISSKHLHPRECALLYCTYRVPTLPPYSQCGELGHTFPYFRSFSAFFFSPPTVSSLPPLLLLPPARIFTYICTYVLYIHRAA